MPNDRAWIRQPSGRRLNLASPTPFDFEDRDVAIGLSRTFRWGGHSVWPLPLSVAQHSLSVLELMRQMAKSRLPRRLQLLGLLHDADEGLLLWDCVGPAKPLLGPAYQALTDRLMSVVLQRFQLSPPTGAEKQVIKAADKVAAAGEAIHVAGWTEKEVRADLRITTPPPIQDPLIARYGGAAWEPWSPGDAADRFMAALAELRALPE